VPPAAHEISDRPVVLITGCSSGIGLASARRFAREGYRVFASMRRSEERGAGLRGEAARLGWSLATPEIDVTSDASVDEAIAALLGETGGRLDVLVNNAGYLLFGPVEEVAPSELAAQLETNVVGVLRMVRAVLPAMRARGAGAIVNMSSVSGRVALPVVGCYHATKFALEALTESLRYEVWPFGVRVTCIEPGPFKTDLHAKEVRAAASGRPGSPYADLLRAYDREFHRLPRGEVDAVADTIFRAATHPSPKLRWPVGPRSFLGAKLRPLSPDRLYELLVRFTFGLWRRKSR
jgi:NAD(P)-dependent dehydrogenase (short-subunit alcohol dehydrogenase family)